MSLDDFRHDSIGNYEDMLPVDTIADVVYLLKLAEVSRAHFFQLPCADIEITTSAQDSILAK